MFKKIQNLTVGILTCDQSSTYEKTIKSLLDQEYQPAEIIIIRNITPVSKAVFNLINKTVTEYVVILDDDMTFIHPDALKNFVFEIDTKKIDEVIFMLEDPIFGKIKGIRIYRTDEIKSILNTLIIDKDWDVDINKKLKEKNTSLTIDIIVGKHHEEWTSIDLYWKMFTIAKKLKLQNNEHKLGWIKRHINSLIKIKENEQLILFAFSGFIDGIRDDKKEYFLSYENKFNNPLFKEIEDYVNPNR